MGDDSGKTVFLQKDVEVPASCSPLAAKIAASKFLYGVHDDLKWNAAHRGRRRADMRSAKCGQSESRGT